MSELVKRAKAALVKALPLDDACHVDEAHGVVDGWVDFEAATIAVIREVQAEMRKPDSMTAGAMIDAAYEVRMADPERFSSVQLFCAMLDAFAREHGLADG